MRTIKGTDLNVSTIACVGR